MYWKSSTKKLSPVLESKGLPSGMPGLLFRIDQGNIIKASKGPMEEITRGLNSRGGQV